MPNAFSKLTLLIAEDQAPVSTLLKAQLRAMGITDVHVATTAAEAYQLALAHLPDIMLIDWELADEDETGLEFTRWVRDNVTHSIRKAPIILMSGYNAPHRVAEARDSGITEYLAKPFDGGELARAISYVIEHPRNFIETDDYFGPDRRRAAVDFKGPDRRGGKKTA